MSFVVFVAALLGGLLLVGTVCAVADGRKGRGEDAAEQLPRVVVSQEVPSVFDTFKGKK